MLALQSLRLKELVLDPFRAPNLGQWRVTSPQAALKNSSKIFLKAGFNESAGES
jgi:hypothetical protein